MKTKKKILPTFSGEIKLTIPAGWTELTEKQLRYAFFLLSADRPETEILTYALIRWANIKVITRTDDGWYCSSGSCFRKKRFLFGIYDILYFQHLVEWLVKPSISPVRFGKLKGYQAISARLLNLSFRDYLILENYYQGFLSTRDDTHIIKMTSILYRDRHGDPAKLSRMKTLDKISLFSVFHWFFSVKNLFASTFLNFFRLVDTTPEDDTEQPDPVTQMNMQIRVLTGGDITKENQVLDMDCWRALTELDAKAREAKELEKKYGH